MNPTEITVRGKRCFVYENGAANALLIQPVDEHEATLLSREAEIIGELTKKPFTLAAFLVEDWNRELSPWEAPAVFGDESFGAGARDTLSFITGELLPEFRGINAYLGGYSLAGLFALWAAYQTDVFCGIAAVSPSVWFPGWISFAESNVIRSPLVYLSLGDREEKTKNKTMAVVGENIRRQYERLQNAGSAAKCTLEWNPGNHFQVPEQRTAKGFAWLLNSSQEV